VCWAFASADNSDDDIDGSMRDIVNPEYPRSGEELLTFISCLGTERDGQRGIYFGESRRWRKMKSVLTYTLRQRTRRRLERGFTAPTNPRRLERSNRTGYYIGT
jgi:hypothetical protein